MKITIEVSSREAETILFALALRAKQAKLSMQHATEAIDVGERFDRTFTRAFGWDPTIDRMQHYLGPIKRTTITFYDYPPLPPPQPTAFLCAVCGKSGPEHGHYDATDPNTHKFVCGTAI